MRLRAPCPRRSLGASARRLCAGAYSPIPEKTRIDAVRCEDSRNSPVRGGERERNRTFNLGIEDPAVAGSPSGSKKNLDPRKISDLRVRHWRRPAYGGVERQLRRHWTPETAPRRRQFQASNRLWRHGHNKFRPHSSLGLPASCTGGANAAPDRATNRIGIGVQHRGLVRRICWPPRGWLPNGAPARNAPARCHSPR